MLIIERKLHEFFNYVLVPQRIILCAFGFLAVVNACTMRLCLDFSLDNIILDCELEPQGLQNWLTSLTVKQQKNQRIQRNLECAKMWSTEMKILVGMVFYLGFILTSVPGGRWAERYGGKWVLGWAIFLTAMLTIITPTAVRYGGPLMLLLVRLLIGLCEGPVLPAITTMLAQWVPARERGLLGSCVLSGSEIGDTVAQVVNGLLFEQQDWPMGFYLLGASGILWFLGYALICASKPDASRFIRNEERDYLKRKIKTRRTPATTPWQSILTSVPVWALIAATMQYNWHRLGNKAEVQQLLHNLKGKNFWEAAEGSLTVGVPYICNWLASLSTGEMSDYLIAQRYLSRTTTRRLVCGFVAIGLALVSVYLFYNREASARLGSILCAGAYYASVQLLPMDMSPNYAGTLTGLASGLGALPALLMPYLEEMECDNESMVSQIRAALLLICSSYISGDIQSYNHVPNN